MERVKYIILTLFSLKSGLQTDYLGGGGGLTSLLYFLFVIEIFNICNVYGEPLSYFVNLQKRMENI